eukprot:7380022-Prymnesium_polylepis.1
MNPPTNPPTKHQLSLGTPPTRAPARHRWPRLARLASPSPSFSAFVALRRLLRFSLLSRDPRLLQHPRLLRRCLAPSPPPSPLQPFSAAAFSAAGPQPSPPQPSPRL